MFKSESLSHRCLFLPQGLFNFRYFCDYLIVGRIGVIQSDKFIKNIKFFEKETGSKKCLRKQTKSGMKQLLTNTLKSPAFANASWNQLKISQPIDELF